jgi:mRNA interferase RelE/StbE
VASEDGRLGKSRRYEILLDPRAARDLKDLSETDSRRVRSHISALSLHPRPHGCKQLEKNVYRVRVGAWRIIYLVYDGERRVIISRVKRRREDTYC